MKTLTLEVYRDFSSDTLGFIVKGTPKNYDTYSDQNGRLIAHDVVEHVNGPTEIGSLDDELEAMGACLFGRYWAGMVRDEDIASDVSLIFHDFSSGKHLGPAPVTQTIPDDEVIDSIIALAKRELDDLSLWPKFEPVARARIRIGFRKARRKYREPRIASNIFHNIQSAVARSSSCFDFEGQLFRLRYNETEAFCEEIY